MGFGQFTGRQARRGDERLAVESDSERAELISSDGPPRPAGPARPGKWVDETQDPTRAAQWPYATVPCLPAQLGHRRRTRAPVDGSGPCGTRWAEVQHLLPHREPPRRSATGRTPDQKRLLDATLPLDCHSSDERTQFCVRRTPTTWSPLTESNRRPSPYHPRRPGFSSEFPGSLGRSLQRADCGLDLPRGRKRGATRPRPCPAGRRARKRRPFAFRAGSWGQVPAGHGWTGGQMTVR
jgi:hypothetical protein